MPDVKQFIRSLKISWIRRFHQSNATWRLILIQDLPLFYRTLQCGPEFLLKLRSDTRNKFWQDVLTSTHTFTRKMKGDTYEQFLSTSFLFNEDVKINHHHHPVPCFTALAIMSFHIPRSLVAFRISTTLPAPSQLASPSVIFSRCFPLLRFPSIILVVMRCSNFSLLIT